jgi:hypothetical protein
VDSPYPIPTRETLRAKPEKLKYPKKYPKFNHLGKNLEVLIGKALREENPEKRQGFANAIAYYMKLTYSNWHKELMHDDAIQSELSNITEGRLEFTNKPFVRHRTDMRGDQEYGGGGRNFRKGYGRGQGRGPGGGGRPGNGRGGRNFKKRY